MRAGKTARQLFKLGNHNTEIGQIPLLGHALLKGAGCKLDLREDLLLLTPENWDNKIFNNNIYTEL